MCKSKCAPMYKWNVCSWQPESSVPVGMVCVNWSFHVGFAGIYVATAWNGHTCRNAVSYVSTFES